MSQILSHLHLPSVSGSAQHTCLVLHGLLGSGRNWRSFCKSLQRQLPAWDFALLDLRGHGDSPSFSSPHTLDATAQDVAAWMATVHTRLPPIQGFVGHSFGGKVLIRLLSSSPMDSRKARAAVVVDSYPGAWNQALEDRDRDSVAKVFDVIQATQKPFRSYKEARKGRMNP